ncbi:hypothetical protein A6A27_27920 [Micromonospora sp. CB01531]|nr:hypothetical protein A6A27_27920 [Micromonospora sp. CB01531]
MAMKALFCYLDVSLPETLRRHVTRPEASEFTTENMTSWYSAHDILGWPGELVIDETSTTEDTITTIAAASGLPQAGHDNDLLPAVP